MKNKLFTSLVLLIDLALILIALTVAYPWILSIIYMWLHPINPTINSDFIAFYTGARLGITEPSQLYNLDTQLNLQEQILQKPLERSQALMFINPPIAALLIMPFSLLPYEWAYRLYFFVILTLTFICITKMKKIFGSKLSRSELVLCTFVLLSSTALYQNLLQTQWTPLILLGLIILAKGIQQNRPINGFIALSIFSLKPQLAFLQFIPFIAEKNKRWLLSGVLCVSMIVILSIGCFDFNTLLSYVDLLRAASHFGNDYGAYPQYLFNLLNLLQQPPFNLSHQLSTTINAIVLFSLILIYYPLFRNAKSTRCKLFLFYFFTVLSLLVSPWTRNTSLLINILPACYLLTSFDIFLYRRIFLYCLITLNYLQYTSTNEEWLWWRFAEYALLLPAFIFIYVSKRANLQRA